MTSSASPASRRLAIWCVTALVTVALVVGSTALAGSVTGLLERAGIKGSSFAPTSSGIDGRKHLSVKAKVQGGPLIPGIRRTLLVTISNPLNQTVKVTSITATPRAPKATGCLAKWVKTSTFVARKKTRPITVKPHKSAKVRLTITLKNLSGVNQDACKSTKIPLKLKASARQA